MIARCIPFDSRVLASGILKRRPDYSNTDVSTGGGLGGTADRGERSLIGFAGAGLHVARRRAWGGTCRHLDSLVLLGEDPPKGVLRVLDLLSVSGCSAACDSIEGISLARPNIHGFRKSTE